MGFVLNYLRNFASVMLGKQPVRPLLVSYFITHRCALDCAYCSDGEARPFREDPVPELPLDGARELIGILSRSTDTLDVTGGEPMARGDAEDLLAHARSLGMRTVLNTKGIGLRDRPDLVRLSDVLVLSVDSLHESRLAGVIGADSGAAAGILEGMRFAMEACPGSGTRLVLGAVATPGNLGDVLEVCRFARDNGLGFQVSPHIIGMTANPALRGNPDYARVMDAVIEAKESGAAVLGVHGYLRGIRDFARHECMPLLMPVIRPDGRLYHPCLELKRADVSVLDEGSYEAALGKSRRLRGSRPACDDRCQIFCHMALTLFQRSPMAALREGRAWRAMEPRRGKGVSAHVQRS